MIIGEHGTWRHCPGGLQLQRGQIRVHALVDALVEAPEIVGKTVPEDQLVVSFGEVDGTEHAPLAQRKLGNHTDGIVPAVGVERTVVDRLDDAGEGLERNISIVSACGHDRLALARGRSIADGQPARQKRDAR